MIYSNNPRCFDIQNTVERYTGASRAMPCRSIKCPRRERSIRLIIKFERRLIIKSLITITIRISSKRSKSLVESIIDRKLAQHPRARECTDFSLVKLRTHILIPRPHVTSPSKHRALGLQNNYVSGRLFFHHRTSGTSKRAVINRRRH